VSNKYQIEVLLRPPVEFFAAFVTLCGASIILVAPETLLMPPTIAVGCVCVLIPVGLYDIVKGLRVVRYRRKLSRTPALTVRTEDIPVYDDKLYLGDGFEWSQRHTQRHADTFSNRYQPYFHLGEYEQVRAFEKRLEKIPLLKYITCFTRNQSMFNPWPPKSPLGGSTVLHGVEEKKRPIMLDRRTRFLHTYISGASGSGKTEQMEILISQDIRRSSKDVVIAFDPKGSHTLLTTMYTECERAGRADDLLILHLGFPEISALYNAAGNFTRITEVPTRLSNKISGEGDSAAFRAFGWRYLNLLMRVGDELKIGMTLVEIRRHIGDFDHLYERLTIKRLDQAYGDAWHAQYETFERSGFKTPKYLEGRSTTSIGLYVFLREEAYEIDDQLYRELEEVYKMSRDFYSRITASIRPVIDKLTAGQLAQLLSPTDEDLISGKKKLLDWEQAIRRRSVVYVALDAMADIEIAQVVGSGIIGDFVATCSRIYKSGVLGSAAGGDRDEVYDIWVHMDEADALLGDEFIPTVNKVRGAGVGLTVYSQVSQDFETGLGSLSKAKQAIGSMSNLVMFRTGNEETGKLITDNTEKVNVLKLVNITGATDSSNILDGTVFTSRNEDRAQSEQVPMLTPAMLMRLPVGEAFCSIDGARVLKMKVPLRVRGKREKGLPKVISEMCEYMERNYESGPIEWLSFNV